MSKFERFCGSVVWDDELTWNTPNDTLPDLPLCTERLSLIWTPSILLLVMLPPYLWFLRCNTAGRSVQSLTNFSLVKSVLPLLCISFPVWEFVSTNSDEKTAAQIVTSSIQIVSLVLSGILVQVYRKYGQYTSGPLWVFWLVGTLAEFVRVYIRCKRYLLDEDEDLNSVILHSLQSAAYLCLFVLSSITDASKETLKRYKHMSPELTSSFLSLIIYQWMSPIMSAGYKKEVGIERSDLYTLTAENRAEYCLRQFQNDWEKKVMKWRKQSEMLDGKTNDDMCHSNGSMDETTPLIVKPGKISKKKRDPSLSLVKTLMKHWAPLLIMGYVFRLITVGLRLINPQIQEWLIKFMEARESSSPPPFWQGIFYCVLIMLNSLLIAAVSKVMWWTGSKVFIRLKTALMATIYRKSLRMSGEAKQESTTGEMVNLLSVDVQRVISLIHTLFNFVEAPLQAGITIYMLYNLLGYSVFAGLGCMMLAPPISFVVGYFQRKLRMSLMKIKDERIRLVTEVLSGIKVIKLYAWESSFEKKISELREKELVRLRLINIINGANVFVYDILPLVVILVTFLVYTSSSTDHVLPPSVAFVSLTLFEILRGPLNNIPQTIAQLIMCSVSLKRILKFLKNPDLNPGDVILDKNSKYAVSISGGSFAWLEGKSVCLHNIDFAVEDRSLTAVVGSVGCGKSSLLAALIGDLHRIKGVVKVKGAVAYVAQQAFILSGTLKDNILFGSPYDEEKYNRVLHACCLIKDLGSLPKGDRTLIGEKGINLSGGQKQRISLARAVYSDADIFLLDDPLSAVDAHVGKHIFEHVLSKRGLLAKKTCIMVTHAINWLPQVDDIYVMKSGLIGEHGTYDTLLSHNGEFAHYLKTYLKTDVSCSTDSSAENDSDSESSGELMKLKEKVYKRVISVNDDIASDDDDDDDDDVDINVDKATDENEIGNTGKGNAEEVEDEEKVETGNVSFKIYLAYLKAMGLKGAMVALMCSVLQAGTNLLSGIWLSKWTGDPVFSPLSNSSLTEKSETMSKYIGIYGVVNGFNVIFILVNVLIVAFCFYLASINLHKRLLTNILRTRMSFFDVKPLGMIVNRFSMDMDVIDNSVGWSVLLVQWCGVCMLANFIGLIYSTPLSILFIVPMTFLYGYVQRYYVKTARQLRRLKSKAYSPIYSHFNETITGNQTIRAYQHQDRFEKDNITKIEESNIYHYFNDMTRCWLQARMNVFSCVLVTSTCVFCIVSTKIPFLHSHMSSSIMGLAISMVLQATDELMQFVWVTSNAENDIVSVERVVEFSEMEKEDDWFKSGISDPWPNNGGISFTNYCTRYRDGLDLVIKGIDVNVRPQEKIGIVGRTGAGKSSLTLALFRMIESAGGSIVIDGVDISTLGLHELRSKLTILPQDPVLFSGSLRENMDPFGKYTDIRLWEVLEQCHLKDYVLSLPEKLEYECGENGQNLSVGQKQLICLARALLRKTKILIIDEATSAVDMKTDDLIQKTIRREFADCTTLTIAHRINTIIDSDRILVLDSGKVAEFDTPQNLLAIDGGIFSKLASDAGISL